MNLKLEWSDLVSCRFWPSRNACWQRCIFDLKKSLARLVLRDIQLNVFDGWIYIKTSGLCVLLWGWSGFIMPNVKFQYNKNSINEKDFKKHICSFFHMKITASDRKILHEGCNPCCLHLPIFSIYMYSPLLLENKKLWSLFPSAN